MVYSRTSPIGALSMRGRRPGDSRLIPPEWTVEIEGAPSVDGGQHYFADLYRSGELMCRIVLSGTFSDRELAEEALWARLRGWLEDYEMRPHSGDSGFQIL